MQYNNHHSQLRTPNSELSRSCARGLTLIETVVYVALLSVIAALVIQFMISLSVAYGRAAAEREVISQGRLLVQTINRMLGEARETYPPTSRFNTAAGQLSYLANTPTNAQHQTHYADLWLENGQLLFREEGTGTSALSAPSVRVTRFRIERFLQGPVREAVRILMDIEYANPRYSASTTIETVAAMRGNY